MPLSDVVDVSISLDTATVEAAGFGVPLFLFANGPAGFTERTRTYTSVSEITTDGFGASHPLTLAATIYFSQDPKPESLMAGRCALPPTQRIKLTPIAANSTAYKVYVNGTAVTVTSDGSATVAEIVAAMKTAIDALAVSGLTTTDQTTRLDVTMTSALWCSVEVADNSLITVVQDHADPGLATDLAAIADEDDTWYGIHYPWPSKACIEAIATYAEANDKLYFSNTQDNTIETSAISGTDDVAESTRNSAYDRTSLVYRRKLRDFCDAAILATLLSSDPGEITLHLKTFAGVSAEIYTSTQLTRIASRNANYYYTIAGNNVFRTGCMASGEWADAMRDRDYLAAQIQEGAFLLQLTNGKIPFTDEGIAKFQAMLHDKLQEGEDLGILAANPKFKIQVPLAADISASERTLRRLTGVNAITWDAQLAGAIHTTSFTGVLT